MSRLIIFSFEQQRDSSGSYCQDRKYTKVGSDVAITWYS